MQLAYELFCFALERIYAQNQQKPFKYYTVFKISLYLFGINEIIVILIQSIITITKMHRFDYKDDSFHQGDDQNALQYIKQIDKKQEIRQMMKFPTQEKDSMINSEYEPNQQGFQQSNATLKKQKIKHKMKKKKFSMTFNNGAWEMEEDRMFMHFMQKNQQIFENKTQRRRNHVFKLMAQFLKTRTSEQCRSHHQKYEIRFGQFANIIQHISDKLEKNEFSQNKVNLNFNNVGFSKQKGNLKKNLMNSDVWNNEEPNLINQKTKYNNLKSNLFGSFEQVGDGQGYEIFRFINTNIQISIFLDLDVFLKD